VPIQGRIRAHNDTVRAFLPECGPGTLRSDETDRIAACAARHQKLTAADKALQAEKEAFASDVAAAVAVPCASLVGQVERDQEAIDVLARSMRVNVEELKRWETLGRQTQQEAITSTVSLLTVGIGKHLMRKEETLKAAYLSAAAETDLASRPDVKRFIDQAFTRYREADWIATQARRADSTLEATELFKNAAVQIIAIAGMQREGDDSVRAFLANPTIRARGADYARAAVDMLATADEFKGWVNRWTPLYTVTSYVFDLYTGLETLKIALASADGQSTAIGSAAQGLKALQSQLVRSTAKLRACRHE
jgi:hypothetical protein